MSIPLVGFERELKKRKKLEPTSVARPAASTSSITREDVLPLLKISTRAGATWADVFPFGGRRCDRLTAMVREKLRHTRDRRGLIAACSEGRGPWTSSAAVPVQIETKVVLSRPPAIDTS